MADIYRAIVLVCVICLASSMIIDNLDNIRLFGSLPRGNRPMLWMRDMAPVMAFGPIIAAKITKGRQISCFYDFGHPCGFLPGPSCEAIRIKDIKVAR